MIKYADVGVDIEEEAEAVSAISKSIIETFKNREGKIGRVLEEFGHFSGLLDMGEFALAITTDGVGSKVLVSQEAGKFDTVGIDLVAMNVNDIICNGAEPVAMVNYIAVQKPNPRIMYEIGKGLEKGARESGIAIVGGETATLPEIIKGKDGKGFDLAGTCIGIVKKENIITGKDIKEGDVVLGIESSGIHSNGLTLARKVFEEKGFDYKIPNGKSVKEELLTPTRIYVKPVLQILKELDIHGLAHITGGGLLKLKRIGKIAKLGFILDNLPEPQPIFKEIQRLGNVSNVEMYKTFNMGIGFCIVLDEGESPRAIEIIEGYGFKAKIIGKAVKEEGCKVKLPSLGIEI
ncbi:MAG: phosphoribosylformylglycinamidine cyclo-ligase [Candidatus Hydrothermarchaeota archaeon]